MKLKHFLFIRQLLCIILISFPLLLHAQTGKFYSTDHELSSSLINQLYQDSKGYIWIATEYGLNVFDGMRFSIYKHNAKDSTSLKNNYVRSLFEDSQKRFWVGCIDGLLQYDPHSDSFHEIPLIREGKQVYPHIMHITELRNGEIWIATSGQGIFKWNEKAKKGESIEYLMHKLNSYYLNSICEDHLNNIWIGSENRGLARYTPINGEVRIYRSPEIQGDYISAITENTDGDVFVGTFNQGLSRYDREKEAFIPVKYHNGTPLLVKSLFPANNGKLYIGTDGQGLKVYNPEKNEAENHEINSAPFILNDEKIHSILEDRDRNLWFGVFQKGIVFIPNQTNPFQYFGNKSIHYNPIGTGCVMAILKDSQNKLWISADSEGLYELDENGVCLHHYAPGNQPGSVTGTTMCMFEDSEKNFWLGSYTDGLGKLDRHTGQCEYLPPPFRSEKIYSITEDRYKNLYISVFGSGFYIYNLITGKITHYESSKDEQNDLQRDELYNDWINHILCDREGLIWLAHYKGVSCFNPKNGSFINFLHTNNLINGVIGYVLHEDYEGNIWIGTSDGLYHFDKKREEVKRFTTEDGLPNNVICGICEDENHHLWISTYMGICNYDTTEKHFTNYYAGDGLQGNEFTHGAFFQDNDWKIYFGGIYGVTSFYPKDITDPTQTLRVEITNFYLFNTPVNIHTRSGGKPVVDASPKEADRYRLCYNDNTFSITFSAFQFATPDQITYQYNIKELGTQWMNTAPGINHATYNNLPPGEYTFQVRTVSHGQYSPIRTLYITIAPPWYLSWWAYLIYACIVLLFLLGILNYLLTHIRHRREMLQKEHAEQLQEAKLQFFINISHEIRTPMTLIINPLEKLLKEAKDDSAKPTYLMMYRNAQRILRLINQLMDIRKLDKGQMFLKFRETDIVGFIDDLMLTFDYPAKKKNIRFTFEHADPQLKVWIDLNNFDKVLLNILSNAFKYTPENGEITVRLTTGHNQEYKGALKNYFEISVTDNGIGIDKNKIEQIFERFYQINNDVTQSNFGTGIGLHLSRSLVILHHGILFAENRTDCPGSRFVIRIPLGCDHLKTNELENPEDSPVTYPSSVKLVQHNEFKETEENAEKEKSQVIKSKNKPHVLIVEDEDEIQAYLRKELITEFRISSCSNGKEALEFVLLHQPDLILSDVMMPEMDGITLCKKIRQNVNINHIPIILLTAKSKVEDKIEGMEMGADAYIVKPFNTDILKGTISNLIANRKILKTKFSGVQLQEDKIKKLSMKSSDEVLLEKVMKIVNENLANPALNVEMLASNVGMSRVHMHRKLKELTNLSARDFIKSIRMKQAATLLRKKKISISEVAYATGFTNLSHFSNTFRECYGMTPKEFRELNSVNEENL